MADWANFGAGVQDELKEQIKQRLFEQMQAANIRHMEEGRSLAQQRLAQDAEQFGARLGHDQDELGFRRSQWTEGAPARDANLGYIRTQTKHLEGTDARQAAEREHDVNLEGVRHGNELEQIRATGAQNQATARIRTRPRIQRVSSVSADGKPVTKFIDVDSGETVHEEAAAPTADERNRGAASGRAMPVINRAGELSQQINTRYGPQARALGTLRELQARANMDPDVAEYLSLVEGFTPLIARAAGHTGVLTEQDVERTIQLLPKPGDSADLATRKLANLDRMLGGGGAAAGGGGGVTIKSITEVKP